MKKTLLLAGVASLFAVNAANAMEIKPYVGLDYNYSTLTTAHNYEYNREFDRYFNNGSVVAGAKLMNNFGLEAYYQRSLNNTKHFVEGEKVTSRIQSYGVDALGYLPLGCEQKVELIAGLGIGEYELKAREKAYDDSSKETGIGYRMSAGAQYNIDNNWAVRGMFRHVVVEGSDLDRVNEYSAGVRYSF